VDEDKIEYDDIEVDVLLNTHMPKILPNNYFLNHSSIQIYIQPN